MAYSVSDQVQQLYVGYLGRAADQNGLNFWVDAINTGKSTIQSVALGFTLSAEYQAQYANLQPEQEVARVYQNVLGRTPDPDGLAFWSAALRNGTASADTLLSQMTAKMGSIDTLYLQNKITAADAYTTAAGSNYDPAAGAAAIGNTAPNAGQTVTLTTGVDTLTGTSGNDVFNAPQTSTGATFGALDSINGGGGNDTLNITSTGAFSTPINASVTNIETVNLAVSAGGVTFDTSKGYTGLTALNVTNAGGGAAITAAGTTAVNVTNAAPGGAATTVNGGSAVNVTVTGAVAADTITVGGTTAATGAVTVNNTSALAITANATAATALTNAATGAGGNIAVTGGTTISVTDNIGTTAANTAAAAADTVKYYDVQGSAISVTGSTATTSVSVTQTAAVAAELKTAASANVNNAFNGRVGVVDGAVTIADANAGSTTVANTISTVSLANYGNSTVSSTALNTLNLSGTGGTLGITEGGSAATIAANKTLALNLGGGNLGTLTDSSNQFSTVNANVTANTTLAGISDTALRTLAVSGNGVLNLTGTNSALTSVTATGAAGLTANLSGVAGVTAVTAANTTGAMTLTLNAGTQSFTGGTGRDIISINADATQAITGGSGTNDQIVLTNVASTYGTSTFAKVTGFEQLVVNDATVDVGSYDVSKFAGIKALEVQAADKAAFTKVAAGTALQLDAATTAVTYQTADTNGANDAVTVTLKGTAVSADTGGGTIGYITAGLTLQDSNAVGIGHVSIVTDATVGGGAHTITTLTDAGLSSLDISGTGALTITTAQTASTSLALSDNDTSTATSSITGLTSTGSVLGNLSYSGSHNFTIGTLTDSVANATITNANTGTTGVLTIGAWADSSLTNLTLNGSVALTATDNNAGAITVSGASDNAAVSLTLSGAGVHTVTLGNGANTLVSGAGADVITVGTGVNAITTGGGLDTINLAAGHTAVDTITVNGAVAGNATNQIAISNFLAGSDVLNLSKVAVVANGAAAVDATATNLSSAATLTDALNLLAAGDGSTNSHVAFGVYNGNTYVVADNSSGATLGAGDAVIKLVGVTNLHGADIHAVA